MSALQAWAVAQGFHRLQLTVAARNHIAVQLYKSLGFEVEGQMRDAVRIGGQFEDELMMAKIIQS